MPQSIIFVWPIDAAIKSLFSITPFRCEVSTRTNEHQDLPVLLLLRSVYVCTLSVVHTSTLLRGRERQRRDDRESATNVLQQRQQQRREQCSRTINTTRSNSIDRDNRLFFCCRCVLLLHSSCMGETTEKMRDARRRLYIRPTI